MANDLVGLLTGISNTQQPMQPMQPIAGTPGFAGMFGAQQAQGLASGLGRIARQGAPSNQERMQEAVSKLDLGSVDGLTTLAKLQQIQGDLAGASQTVAKIKKLQEQKQAGVVQQEKKEAIVSYVEAAFPDKPELLDLAQKGISLDEIKSIGKGEKDYAVVGNSVYIPSTGEFIQGPKTASSSQRPPTKEFNPETNRNELVWRGSDPADVLQRAPIAVDEAKQSVKMISLIDESSDLAREADNRAREATRTAVMLETYLPTAGALGTFEEMIKKAGGTQDEASMARTRAEKLVQGEAIASLPKGPATDKDIELARLGEPPANADAEYLASYARGIAKIAKHEAEYYKDKNAWYSLHNTPSGFDQSQTVKMSEKTLENFKTDTQKLILKTVRDSYGTPAEEDNRTAFEEKYGFDLKRFDEDYELAKKVVSKITGE
jgi:hypothetical protein